MTDQTGLTNEIELYQDFVFGFMLTVASGIQTSLIERDMRLFRGVSIYGRGSDRLCIQYTGVG